MKKIVFFINFLLCLFDYPVLGMDIEKSYRYQQGLSPRIKESPKENEEFFIFDVGQGNSQLVIYKQAKIGFLYDAGSSSKQKHPKLTGLNKGDWEVFLTKKPVPKINLYNLNFNSDMTPKVEPKKEEPKKLSGGSGSSGSQISLKESEKIEDIEESIKSCIEQVELNWLIIFLSHPDKDHINLVNEKSILGNLKVIAFLGGDFLGTESESEVNKVLNFFKSRNTVDTWVEFPFYWGWNDPNGSFKKYSDIRNKFLTNNITSVNREEIKNLSLSKYNPEDFFHGSAWDLLTKVNQKDMAFYEFVKYNPHTPEFALSEDSLGRRFSREVLLNNVLIWAMNHRLYNVNAQSSVISFKLPENNTRLICTGDAEDSTFLRIKKELQERNTIIRDRPEGRENILMVPHHGSKDNKSELMLEIFKPTVFVISAGNGKQYGHPDIETIKWLKEKNFMSGLKEKGGEKGKFICFNGKEKQPIMYNSIKLNKTPILSTNLMGSIRFTNENFFTLFKSLIKLETGQFRINFSRASSEISIDFERMKNKELTFTMEEILGHLEKKLVGSENLTQNNLINVKYNDQNLNAFSTITSQIIEPMSWVPTEESIPCLQAGKTKDPLYYYTVSYSEKEKKGWIKYYDMIKVEDNK